MELHIAQFNAARLRRPIDHPESASYSSLLDEVNAAADASPGFVWRHGIDSRDADEHVYEDPLVLVNLSTWASPAHLRDYVYKEVHRDVYRRRAEWFDDSGSVMWWAPAGERPTLQEGIARLEFLRRFGPSAYGFETGQRFPQLVVATRPLDHPDVAPLIARLNAELLAETPEGGTNFFHLAAEHVEAGNGAFFVAYVDGVPSACGAYRRVEGLGDPLAAAEVKRMWADPAQRGAKLGAAVLCSIETAARADGFRELRLETGEYLTAAVGLYRKVGFEACAPWGEYVGVDGSYTMSKPLRSGLASWPGAGRSPDPGTQPL